MSILQEQIGSILDIMVNATVLEISKVIGASTSLEEQVSKTTDENTHETPNEKVIYLLICVLDFTSLLKT